MGQRLQRRPGCSHSAVSHRPIGDFLGAPDQPLRASVKTSLGEQGKPVFYARRAACKNATCCGIGPHSSCAVFSPGLHCMVGDCLVSQNKSYSYAHHFCEEYVHKGQLEECVYSLVRISAQPPRNGALVHAVVAALALRSRVELLYFIIGL